MTEQPCENFESQNFIGNKGEIYDHQCPICDGWRGFCINCYTDHHKNGWSSCKPENYELNLKH